MRADTGVTDGGPATNDSVVHIGSTGCTGEPADGGVATCAKLNKPSYRFAAFRPSANVLALDLRELLKDQKLATVPNGCHSFGPTSCAKPFEHAGLDFATGQPIAPQAQTFITVK
jgi:hypothetical protein